ncbi:hypothetical protein J3A83DRAFT_4424312, partial [Scleroderma citrinum]
IDVIPKGPSWCCTTISYDGYLTEEPIHLYWCNALEVIQELFRNPIFSPHMEYDPYVIFNGLEWEYSEWMSSDKAHWIQDQLPEGAMIVPILLASNKALVTRMTGDLEMHPLFITIANIHSNVCMKATSHTWVCITYIPTPEFRIHPNFQSILEAHLWH